MRFIQETYILHRLKIRHILLDGHTVLGLITHEKSAPTEFKAILKQGSENKEIKFFDSLEEAKRWLLTQCIEGSCTAIEKIESFDTEKPIFVYHNKILICRFSNFKILKNAIGYSKIFILNNWAADASELKNNYSFSNKKLHD